ncbi:MAG: FAD-dependent oxidoreductase [Kofleriaceae bacterium]
MTRRPAILAVDDELPVAAAITRDLRKRYGDKYWVMTAASGAEAIEIVQELVAKREPLALVVADQRMPKVTGIDLLREVGRISPQTRTVLLTAYADTQVAIDAINEVGLDHYLQKPWDPPDDKLYPILDELLRDWRTSTYLPWDGIQVLGAAWSVRTHELQGFLARQRIPYHYADVETDARAGEQLAKLVPGTPKLPVIVFADGTVAVDPDLQIVAGKVGLRTEATAAHYDVVVIGAGPAGLAASVYCAAEGVRCLVIEKAEIGGLASTSPRIENYLGFPAGIAGADLTRRARDQATRLGAEILSLRTAEAIRLEDPYRVVELADGSEITASAVLLATGAAFSRLPAAGAERFHGAGIHYAVAHAEAKLYEGQDVIVVGGGNSAAQAALLLARHARAVHMLVRKQPIASQYLLDALAASERVKVICESAITEVRGTDRLTEVVVTGDTVIPATAIFVFVGVKPASEMVANLVVRDARGFILTGPQLLDHNTANKKHVAWPLEREPMLLETSVPGIFAVGDVRAGTIGRVAWAAGEGGAAVSMILEYLKGWDAGSRGAAEA